MQVIKQYLSEMSKKNDDRLYPDPITFVINDHHQFMYFKPGKTAGTSIFGNYLRPFDNKNIFSNESEKFDKWLKTVNDLHIAKMFKFIVKRNPFDRILSAAIYFKIKPINFFKYIYKDYKINFYRKDKNIFDEKGFPLVDKYECFANLLDIKLDEDFEKYCIQRMSIVSHIVPIYDYVCINNVIFVNEFLEFENLDKNIITISKRFNIKNTLPHVNKTKHEHYSKYYDSKSIDYISEMYEKDIDLFCYKFMKKNKARL